MSGTFMPKAHGWAAYGFMSGTFVSDIVFEIKLRLTKVVGFHPTPGQEGVNSNPLLDHPCRPRRSCLPRTYG